MPVALPSRGPGVHYKHVLKTRLIKSSFAQLSREQLRWGYGRFKHIKSAAAQIGSFAVKRVTRSG